jgi:DNA-binding NarL/FixJ family response regulator
MATSASTVNKPSVRVLLADDSSTMRQAIRRLLAERPDEVEIIAEATNFCETVELAWKLKPQVIVMDLHMPKRTATQDVKRALHDASVSRLLVISVANDHEAKELAECYGANVFLDKMDLYNALVPAIISLALC